MKLLFAIKKLHDMPGGAERVLCIVASELAARGHDVTILSFDASVGTAFFDLDVRVRRTTLGIGDASRPAKPWETIRRTAALRRVVRLQRPDVVIGFNASIYVLLALAMFGTGIPLVASEHNVPDLHKNHPLRRSLMRFLAPRMDRITVVSEDIRRQYPRNMRRRMFAITNPVLPPIGVHEPQECTAPNKRILNVGRFVPQKDQETLLRAFAQVARKHPDWHLCILGDGPLRPNLERLRNDLGLTERVELPGVTKRMEREYAKADIFALTSRFESFGLVTVEAMQHALPVVAFADCPGTNDILWHGQNGFLADNTPNRTDAFAHALERLISDPALRDRLGREGRRSILGKFDKGRVCDDWEDLLQSLCGDRCAGKAIA